MKAILVASVLGMIQQVIGRFTCPPPGIPAFNCPTLPTPPPATDVRRLRPGNIGVVMALGDSITAGALMKDEPLEYRGDIYSTGGDENTVSLANIIKKNYNPKLTGFSTGTTIPFDPLGDGLNMAVSGATVWDVPSQIARMHTVLNNKYKDHKDDWKLLTMFIGANDACGCQSARSQPDSFEGQLRRVLQYIHGNFSKTFVNVMTLFNISAVWDDAQGSLYCKKAVPYFHECSCLEANKTRRTIMDELILKYNVVTHKVVNEMAALKDPQFTAVVQPGVDDDAFGTWGEDFLSDLDCFHPSLCTNQGFALCIWNNMFQPEGQKARSMDPKKPLPFFCPTQDMYLQ